MKYMHHYIFIIFQNITFNYSGEILKLKFSTAERIDVWIGNDATDPTRTEDGDICFEYIGYITLSDNGNTKFKCRELKTISIPSLSSTKYIKLTLYENHPNNLNVYNQVIN